MENKLTSFSKNSARAFAPAHISGIFIIDIKKDPIHSGSMGAGICLEDGAVTAVRKAPETAVKINGYASDAATTLSVVNLLTPQPVLIDTTVSIPISAGFGSSAAGALSTALAVNEALCLNLTYNEIASAAHRAELTNRTGLGDVAGMICGGIDIRKHAGIPPIGSSDRIPCRNEIISWVSFGGISTRTVISDEMKKKSINKSGRFRLRELIKKPTIDNFFRQSLAFAKVIDLMSPQVRDAIEAVEAAGGLASQAMLGDAVFAINDNGVLTDFGDVGKSRISHAGAHLL
jgi:pantoate kinase